MKIQFDVSGLPPKKDGANSMWRKGSELARLKSLRKAASEAMKDLPLVEGNIFIKIQVFADPSKGDLDNFITGICDGLMAAHPRTPIDLAQWQDVPEPAKPQHAICYSDDILINRISAVRFVPGASGCHYLIEMEW